MKITIISVIIMLIIMMTLIIKLISTNADLLYLFLAFNLLSNLVLHVMMSHLIKNFIYL